MLLEGHLHGELQKGDAGFLTPGESTPHSSTTEAYPPPPPRVLTAPYKQPEV